MENPEINLHFPQYCDIHFNIPEIEVEGSYWNQVKPVDTDTNMEKSCNFGNHIPTCTYNGLAKGLWQCGSNGAQKCRGTKQH